MKIISRFRILLAEKETREHRTISLQKVADETKISIYTIKKLNADDLREFPREAMEALCVYFNCKPGDLFAQQSRDAAKDVKSDIRTPTPPLVLNPRG